MRYSQWREKVKEKSAKKGITFPMVSGNTYRRRDKRLKEAGLLDWERFWLVAHRLDTQGMKYMRKKRRSMYLQAKKDKITVQEYRRRIGRWYKRQGWVFLDGTLNPFRMFEWYRDKANADVTPTPKVPKRRKDFREYKKKTRERRK